MKRIRSIQNIHVTTKLDKAANLAALEIFLIQLFPNWTTRRDSRYRHFQTHVQEGEGKENELIHK